MQAKVSAGKQKSRSFTEEARRTQIVSAAIETIAELGYARTSFARIATRAGLSSTGMISYHFAGKDDLVREVVAEIVRVATEYMQPRIHGATGRVGMLRAYIESNVELVAHYPRHLRALLDVLGNAENAAGALLVDAGPLASRAALFEAHLRAGQDAGEFGAFDPAVTALAITGGIDAVVTSCTGSPPDPAEAVRLGRELADVFVRATTPEGSSS